MKAIVRTGVMAGGAAVVALACSAGSGTVGDPNNPGAGGGGGGGGGAGGASGVSGSKRLRDLSSSERGQLCDWSASLQGGYGKHTTEYKCDGGITVRVSSGVESQADCVGDMQVPSSCNATVADAESCVRALQRAQSTADQNPCAGASSLGALGSSDCSALLACAKAK